MSRSKLVGILGGVALMVGMASVAYAIDPPKDDVKINYVDGKKGEVVFKHATHLAADFKGGKLECNKCHHTLKGTAPTDEDKIQKCGECHVKTGETLKKTGDKEAPAFGTTMKDVVFHKMCLECHKENKDKVADKKIAGCANCHTGG